MAVNFLIKRSNVASKRPTAAQLDIGELSLNYESTTPGLFFEDSAGGVRKIGPVEVSASAPNSSPAGSTGNSTGELWFDTGTNNLKIWTGAAFAEARASVATLTTTRTIWGQNFNGSANVSGAISGATNILAGSGTSGAVATPPYLSLGANYTNTALRANCKIRLYENGADIYGFSIGAAGDVQYHSTTTHQFYNSDVATFTVNSTGATSTGIVQGTRFTSTVATGTAPLTVSSTTLVTNLNADSVDGKSFGTFTAAGGVLYATSTTAASGTAAGTAGQALLSAGASAPVWTTLTLENLPDAAFKRSVRVATTTDVGASTFAAGVLTGYDDVVVLNVSTTISSTTATTTSTAGLKPGAVISGNANIPAATTVASITNATTFVMSAAATATAASISTTFTQTIAALAVDGITLALNDRVLVKNQTSAAQNGIYYLSTLGSATVPWVLTRTTDADAASELGGAVVNVDSGTVNGGFLFDTDFKTTDTLNTSAMVWSRIVDTGLGNTTAATIAMNGVQAAGTSDLYARADHVHPTDTSRAPLASPTFTGTPAAPTAAVDTNTTQLATTAFVVGQASATNPLALGTVAVGTSLRYARQDHVHPTTGLGLTSGTLAQFAATTSAQLAGVISDETGSGALVFAASPTLSGTPLSTTAAVDTNTTQIATTAFVVGQASATNPLALGTVAIGTSLRYARQDHVHPTTGLGLTSGTLAQFAATSSSQLAGVISDETGSGALVFGTSPSLTTPALSGETFSTTNNVTAGTNAQGQGALTSDYNVITTAASNPSGVTLPTATTGRKIVIVNKGANPIAVFPATGGTIDALAINTAISIPVNGVMEFNASSTTQWYSTNNLTIAGSFVTSFSAGTTGLTPSTATTGAVTLAGTLAVANGGTGVTTSTGSGSVVLSTSPTLVTPVLGTPTSGNLSNCTNVPAGQLSGTIPSGVLGNSSLFIGTTSIALNRASAAIALTGITSIDGDAASVDGKSFGTFTAAGGILYATSTTAASATAAGTAGQFVKSAGASAPTWATLEMTDIPGAAYKKSVRAATTANLGTVTATSTTLTNAGTLAAFPAQDGVTLVQNDRVLVKNQTSAAQNGIYTLTTVGSISVAWVLTRAADADTSAEIGAAVVAIDEGTANAGELWTTTFKATDTIGTTAMNWFEVVYNSGTWAISTTGSAATLTTTRTLWGQNFNGSANVTGSLTSVGDITGSAAVTLSSAAASALNLTAGTTGAVTVDSGSTGAVNIGNNANAKTITIGNVTGATTINVNSGTGGILVTSPHLTIANQGEVRFREATANGTNYIGLEAPAAVAADLTFILPGSDATTSTGYTLKSNGSAALSFGTANVLTSDSAVASPLDGDLWYNSADGRLYVYYADANTNQWVDVSPVSAGVTNIKILDSIAASFNGTTATFNLTVSSVAVSPVNAQQLLIVVGGIVQAAGTHYTISGSTITFTAGNIPAAGLTFYGVIYGAAVTQNTVADNSITTTKIQNSSVTAAKLSIDATVLPTVDNSFNLGSASFRFANIFTGDLHLKNDRGDWTIIEEEDCLTMRNNKTGKVYDIMMKERIAQ